MGDNIAENGRITRWKVEEFSHGLTIGDMKESISMTRKKVKEYSTGLMEGSTKETGRMANNME
jgi:predicted transcriptional regulator